MKSTMVLAWSLALFMFLPTLDGHAQEAAKPDAGIIHDDQFVPDFDGVCAAGKKMSQGCDAIRKRTILDASTPPWRAIGRVNFASTQLRQHCTGVLVAEQIVLTASHCLYNFPRKAWIPAQSIRFAAGYQRSTAQAVSAVSRYILHPVQDLQSRDFSASFAQDWALLVLAEPIGAQVGFLPLATMAQKAIESADFTLAGYAGLRPHVLSLAQDCGQAAFQANLEVFLQRCSAMHGDSGAPVLVMQDGAQKVAGVFVGVYSNPSDFVTVAIPSSRFEAALQAGIDSLEN